MGEAEPYVIGYCMTDTHGARLFPPGSIKSAHMLRTPYFIQSDRLTAGHVDRCRITGRANFPLFNIDASDETGDGGGELECVGERVPADGSARTVLTASCVSLFALD